MLVGRPFVGVPDGLPLRKFSLRKDDPLHTGDELGEIFAHLKRVMRHNRDIGLPPPPLSGPMRSYLVSGPSPGGGEAEAAVPDTLERLDRALFECTACRRHRGRSRPVVGEGHPRSKLLFVGGAPGEEEDREGRPFVGAAGELLDRIIHAMGLAREEVFLCLAVKCRLPGEERPGIEEVEACLPFLERQIALVRPEVVCTLGPEAGAALLGRDFRMGSGEWRTYGGIPLMATYHPSFLLTNPAAKRHVWEDVKKIMKRLNLKGSPKKANGRGVTTDV